MARSYTHIKQYYEEMEQMHQEGHSCREIGEKFGFTKEQVKECLRRPRRKARKEQESIPKRGGRPAKQIPTTLSALDKEVKQLQMENELLRDFLKAAKGGEGPSQIRGHTKICSQVSGRYYVPFL